jgi:hypothetical protein
MLGSASRSQSRRLLKRRLMLLMLKLAIFIGSDGSDRGDCWKRARSSQSRPGHFRAALKPDPPCRHSLRSGAFRRRRRFHRRHSSTGQIAVHESGLLSPAPFLSARAVAIPELKRRSAGSRAASDVQTLVEGSECTVVAVPGPTLRSRSVAGEKLDRSSVAWTRAGIVNALARDAEDWTGATMSRLNDGRRVEVVTGVDRLGETQILARLR